MFEGYLQAQEQYGFDGSFLEFLDDTEVEGKELVAQVGCAQTLNPVGGQEGARVWDWSVEVADGSVGGKGVGPGWRWGAQVPSSRPVGRFEEGELARRYWLEFELSHAVGVPP